jgi:hypothetical protein
LPCDGKTVWTWGMSFKNWKKNLWMSHFQFRGNDFLGVIDGDLGRGSGGLGLNVVVGKMCQWGLNLNWMNAKHAMPMPTMWLVSKQLTNAMSGWMEWLDGFYWQSVGKFP